MIDQAAAEAIEDVLDDYIHSRTMFTALDITKGVQQRLKDANKFVFEDHRHLSLRDYIHDQCNAELDGTWNRTLIKIDNVDIRPFLYYPTEKDPASYVTKYPVKPKGATGPGPFPAQQFQVLGPATAAVKVPGTCVFNSADRLHVPRRILRSLGLGPGDTMHIIKEDDGLSVVKVVGDGQTVLKDVNVDNRHYLRVTKGFLQAAGLNGAAFTVSEDNGRITIKVQTDDQGNPVPAPVATN